MRVLKVVAEGLTTSFRYPHFMLQKHPTFEMPPPATIYGHIASALGHWFDPAGVLFAYHFTFEAQVTDLEHIILLSPASGKLKGTNIDKVLEGNINPFERQLLYRPRLTLYINQPDWESAFRSPYFSVVLGRSQDLFSYTRISVIELQQSGSAYFEHTLLPYSANRYTNRGYAILMPRYLDYENMRFPNFERYFIVHERIYSKDFIWFGEKPPEQYWIDPESAEIMDTHLGLMFHTFIGEIDGTISKN